MTGSESSPRITVARGDITTFGAAGGPSPVDGGPDPYTAPPPEWSTSGGPTPEAPTPADTAIVNAANSTLLGGGGVDGAIHRAGGPRILEECRRLRSTSLPDGLPAGHAVVTTAGALPARWVIHTVGPVYARSEDRAPVLRSCYTSSLAEADRVGARHVAFPLISAGAYGWPVEDAAAQAVAAIRGARTSVETVTLVAFDAAAAQALHNALV